MEFKVQLMLEPRYYWTKYEYGQKMTTKAKQTITSLPLTALLIITDNPFILQEPVTHPKKSKLYFGQQATQKTSQNLMQCPTASFGTI